MFDKHPNAVDLNFEALGDAGFSIDQINRGLAKEFNADYDQFLKDGGSQDDFLYTYSTVAPKGPLTAATDAIIRSVTSVIPEVAGAIGGARIGAQLAPPIPPQLKFIGGAAGLIGGFLGGSEVGEAGVKALESFDVLETRPVFPSDRPISRGTEVFSDALTTALLAPALLPAKTANFGAQFVVEQAKNLTGIKGKVVGAGGTVLNLAETLPSSVRATLLTRTGKAAELSSAVGSGALGAAFVDEGDVTQLVAETAGGFFEPRALFFRILPRVLRKGKDTISGVKLDAREEKIGQKFRDLIIAHGEDPDALIAEIEANPARLEELVRDLGVDVGDVVLTPAQITGSPILAAFQRAVSQKGGLKTIAGEPTIVGEEASRRAETGYNALAVISESLINSGDQEAVLLGLQIQREAIADILSGRIQQATARQLEAFERLSPTDEGGQNINFEVVGRNLKSRFDEIVDDGRTQETLLWEDVDRSIEIPTTNIIEEFDRLKTEFLLEEEGMPSLATKFVNRRKLAAGLVPEDVPAAVTSAQKAVRDLSPIDKNIYQKFRKDLYSEQGITEYLRFRNVPQDQISAITAAGADPTAADPANDMILAAADALGRRKGVGPSLKADLEAIKRVATANRKLQTAIEDVPEKEDVFDTAQDIAKFRSRMLAMARDAASGTAGNPPDRTAAKIYGELAAAALRDLDQALDAGSNAAYDAARAYSFGFNDAITRTFVGKATGSFADGAEAVTPELLVPELFSSGTSAAALRLAQIQNAATFSRTQMDKLEADGLLDPDASPGDAGGRLSKTTLQEANLQQNLDDTVLYVARNVLDTKTGQVDPDKVRKFMDDPGNQRLLAIFPEIEKDMLDGARFVNAVKISEARKANVASKKGPVVRVLSQLSATDNLSGQILTLANGQKPEETLRVITSRIMNPTKAAKKAMEEAGINQEELMTGLKSAVIDAAWTAAGGTGGRPKYADMGKILFDPMKKTGRRVFADRPGTAGQTRRPSLIDFMKEEGVFTQAEVDRLTFIVEQGSRFQAAEAAGTLSETLTDDVGMLAEALLSIAGSSAATTLTRGVGLRPQGIVEANVGAKFFKNFFGDQAQTHSVSILEKAILEPDYLIALLRSTGSPEAAEAAVRNLNAYLIQAGLRFADDDVSATEEGPFTPPEERPAPILPPTMPALPAAPAAPTPSPAAPAPAILSPPQSIVSASPRPGAQPNVRTRYQQVFPDDIASGIMSLTSRV